LRLPLFRIEGGAQSTIEFRLITPKPLLEPTQLAYLSSAGLVVSPTEIISSSTSPNFFDLHSSPLTSTLLDQSTTTLFGVVCPLLRCLRYLLYFESSCSTAHAHYLSPETFSFSYSFDPSISTITLCYCPVPRTRHNIAFLNSNNHLGSFAISAVD
jgi:hypothetical protein